MFDLLEHVPDDRQAVREAFRVLRPGGALLTVRPSFINPLTVLCHDVGFSNLSRRKRQLCWLILSPITAVGYASHRAETKGTETAY
jgi:ubiquinone/menaquinone biosynthesis C-methylase UbiE